MLLIVLARLGGELPQVSRFGFCKEAVDDLADFFRRVLESDSAHGYYIVGDGLNPTVAELTTAAAATVGAPGAVLGSDEEARARLGDYLAEVVLLDQGTVAAKARDELGWRPTRPGLVDDVALVRGGQIAQLYTLVLSGT